MPYRNLKNGDDLEFHKNGNPPPGHIGGWVVVALLVVTAIAAFSRAG